MYKVFRHFPVSSIEINLTIFPILAYQRTVPRIRLLVTFGIFLTFALLTYRVGYDLLSV